MPSNLAIIKSTYEGNSEENGKKYQAYLAENAEWTEAAGFPYAGTYIGFEEVAKNVFARLGSEWEGYKVEVSDYFVHIWKLQNQKIVKFKQFVDSYLVQNAMSPE